MNKGLSAEEMAAKCFMQSIATSSFCAGFLFSINFQYMMVLFLENTVTSSPEGTKASFWLLLGVDDSYQTAETLVFFCFG